MCTFAAHTRTHSQMQMLGNWVALDSWFNRTWNTWATKGDFMLFGDTAVHQVQREGGERACDMRMRVHVSLFLGYACVPWHVVPVHSCIRFYLCIFVCVCEVLLIQKVLISRNSDSNYIIYINPCVYVWESAKREALAMRRCSHSMVDRSLSFNIICIYFICKYSNNNQNNSHLLKILRV